MTNPFKLNINHNLTVLRKTAKRRSFAILGIINTHYKMKTPVQIQLNGSIFLKAGVASIISGIRQVLQIPLGFRAAIKWVVDVKNHSRTS